MIWASAYYLCLSIVAYLAFAADKRAAIAGRRRTPERRLHMWSWLGGVPGSLVAIYTLRHKNRKAGFMLQTYAAAAAHTVVWALVLSGVAR